MAAAAIAEGQGIEAFMAAMAEQDPAPILVTGGWADVPTPPSPSTDLLPSVLRGAARSDLPERSAIATMSHPTLLLPWDTDPGHPVSTSEELAGLLASSTLEVAATPDAVRRWGQRAADFLRP